MLPEDLSGVVTALVTPFDGDGEPDEEGLRRLTARQAAGGVSGIAAAASTGEGAALEPEEHRRVVAAVADEAAGLEEELVVLAGVGLSSTRAACRLGRAAREAGADGLLVSAPPYNKPPQRGLRAHFRAVAEASGLPVVLYNVPSRTGVHVEAETILELAGDSRFVGVKEASGDLSQVSRIVAEAPDEFAVLSGDDLLTLPLVALGGDGVVAVISNQVPGLLVDLVRAAREGRRERAASLHARMLPLMEANFVETNPIPVKWSLERVGLIDGRLRPPLTPLSEEARETVREAAAPLAEAFEPAGERGAAGGA